MNTRVRLPLETSPTEAHLVLKVLEGRWKLPILLQLSISGPMRFSELARSIPNVSKRMLTQQLKQLQADGLISRHSLEGPAIRVQYRLTGWGRALKPCLFSLLHWADKKSAHQ